MWGSQNSVSTRFTKPYFLTCRVLRLLLSAGVDTIPKYRYMLAFIVFTMLTKFAYTHQPCRYLRTHTRSNPGNMGRAYIPTVDYDAALKGHPHADRIKAKIIEADEFLSTKNMANRKPEWAAAYDLRPWCEFPGYAGEMITSAVPVFLQVLTFGMLGAGGGPTKESNTYAESLRRVITK